MEAQIKLGRVFGVEIGLRYSWLIIAPLITLSIGKYFHVANLDWGAGAIWALAIVTAALFFVLNEARRIDRSLWPSAAVEDAMLPLDLIHTVTPETPVADVWDVMGREKVSQAPVVSGRRLEGIISLDRVLQVLRARRIATMSGRQ